MADTRALRLIGLTFGAVTAAVILVAFLVIASDGSGAAQTFPIVVND
jgi:hypothetical protein